MLSTTRSLTTPAFTADDFVPTQWDSAEKKAKFANHLMRFIANDFPRSQFHKEFYRRLSMTFGHIAHYDSAGFYAHYFESAERKQKFLKACMAWPCYGDSAFTYSDVERAVIARLKGGGAKHEIKPELTIEQKATLKAYAIHNGPNWKSFLFSRLHTFVPNWLNREETILRQIHPDIIDQINLSDLEG